MTTTTLGPDCRLPIGGGNNRCPLPSGHNGDCDPAPATGAVTSYRRIVKRRNRKTKQTGPRVHCDYSRRVADTDYHAGANYCRDCGATDHPPAPAGQ